MTAAKLAVLAALLLAGPDFRVASAAETLGVGLGFGASSKPYADALYRLRENGVFVIKTWNINPDWLDAVQSVYNDVDVDVTVAIPNGSLGGLTGDQGYVDWVVEQLKKHRRIINIVCVSNEPYHDSISQSLLVDAFNKMVAITKEHGLDNEIKVTIPFSSAVLTNTYPVESSEFHPGIIDTIRNIVPTLQNTGSVFSINLYPYFAYSYASDIPLDFALGKDGSLFEAMLRGCRVALDKIGANSLKIIVGETGWPSAGGKDTTVDNEKAYVEHVIDFVRNNPLAETIYLFEAFDESEKPGLETERHFGVGAEDRSPKFNFDIASHRPCSQWGWRFYDFVGIEGNDLGVSVPAGDRNECQPLCAATPGCKGYTWVPDTCYLKTGGKSFTPSGVAYSALLC